MERVEEGPPGPPAWYRRWFGPEYLAVYPHRDEDEAERAVELFLDATDLPEEAPVLDLACGDGRHLRALARRGHRVVGLDLSMSLLARADDEGAGPGPRLVRGDMRALPFRDAAFGGVTSFFTSFGYFESPSEDTRVLREMRRVLRPGGPYLLDFLNADEVRRSLVPREEREIDGRTVRQERSIRDGVVEKRIEISAPGGGDPSVYHERVRLYEPGELMGMLGEAGLGVDTAFGDYEGGAHTSRSPRLILVGHAR